MPDMNKCFDCLEYTCEGCSNLEPDTELINPETKKPLTKSDIDEIFDRR